MSISQTKYWSSPRPSLATPPYRSLLPAGPQGYILYQHRAAVWRFELVALYLCSAIWRVPQKYITYELAPTSPAVFRMSVPSNFDSFRDGWSVAVQLLLGLSVDHGYLSMAVFILIYRIIDEVRINIFIQFYFLLQIFNTVKTVNKYNF